MAKSGIGSVDEYLAAQPAGARKALERVRDTIRKAIPEAEEGLSYGMPAYRVNGRVAVYFAGWKEHYSLYPANGRVVSAFGARLAGFERSKGTVRFPYAKAVPVKLIGDLAKFRAAEVGAAKKR